VHNIYTDDLSQKPVQHQSLPDRSKLFHIEFRNAVRAAIGYSFRFFNDILNIPGRRDADNSTPAKYC
ncbi:MAG: hypothetical protein ABL865_04015, partial [Candidatus Nitrotoga sp.]